MKLKHTLLLLIAVLPLLSGCNNKDDVTGIFTGKTWKLSTILYDNERNGMDYWGSEEDPETARKRSYDLLNTDGNFVISFEGVEADGIIQGTYTGKAVSVSLSGQWSANGDNHEFSTNQKNQNDTDVLATAFVNALNTAYEYKGDSNVLRIYFKVGQVTKVLLLFPTSGN